MRAIVLIFLFVFFLFTPTFSETYLCVEDENTKSSKTLENSVFKRISDKEFEMTLIGSELKVPFNVYFEDAEAITLILPGEFTKVFLTLININKKNKTYNVVTHNITDPITENINIFDVLDSGRCQLL